MKNKFAITAVIIMMAFCQTFGQSPVQSDSSSTSRTRYSAGELVLKGKLDLTKIYLQQVQTLNNVLPYAAFPIRGQASGVKSIDIPASKYTQNKREKVSGRSDKYNGTMNKELYEIIPYTDKADLIKGILFVQEMIDRIDRGL